MSHNLSLILIIQNKFQNKPLNTVQVNRNILPGQDVLVCHFIFTIFPVPDLFQSI